jgi:Cyclin M transmembrane N-terminal domain
MNTSPPVAPVSKSNNGGYLMPPKVSAEGLRHHGGDGLLHSWKSSKRMISLMFISMSVIAASILGTWSGSNRRHTIGNLRPSQQTSISFIMGTSIDRALERSLQEAAANSTNSTVASTDICTLEYCTSNYEEQICAPESDWISVVPVAIQIIMTIVLLSLSAIFSGLTLGLMSLDITGLEIVMAGDDPEQARYAERIFPVRKQGNLLLCTLLLGNVAVNSLLSIIMAAFSGGTVGFVTSTVLIVIFGEILPQALVRVLF